MTRGEKERARELREQLQAVREHLLQIGGEAVECFEQFVDENSVDAETAFEELEHHRKEARYYLDAALGTVCDLTGLRVDRVPDPWD